MRQMELRQFQRLPKCHIGEHWQKPYLDLRQSSKLSSFYPREAVAKSPPRLVLHPYSHANSAAPCQSLLGLHCNQPQHNPEKTISSCWSISFRCIDSKFVIAFHES